MPDRPIDPDERVQVRDPDEGAAPADAQQDGNGGRGWKIAMIVAVLAAALALGVLGSLLFSDGDGAGDEPAGDVRACVPSRDFTEESTETGDECPPKGADKLDGLVQKTDEGGFTIRVIEGGRLGETVDLHVREPDRPYIDIAHAQTHAALGQPIRVYLEEIDGRQAVVYMEDAPLVK